MIDRTKLWPKIMLYSASRGWGYPYTKPDPLDPNKQILDEDLIKKVSRFPLITIHATPFTETRFDVLQRLRQLNPRIKILCYSFWGGQWPYEGTTFWGQMWTQMKAANMILKNVDGGYPNDPGYNFNMGKQDAVNITSTLWKDMIIGSHLYDGIFFDYCNPDCSWAFQGNNEPLDLAAAGYTSLAEFDPARRAGFEKFMTNLKEVDYTGFLYVANAGMPQSMKDTWLDGELFEGWPGFQGGIIKAIDHVIAHPKKYNIVKVECWLTPYSKEWSRMARFALASACLTDSYCFFGPSQDLYTGNELFHNWWWDELSVDVKSGYYPCFADLTGKNIGWLGDKVNPMVKTTEGLLRKDYTKGTVLLNPTNASITIDTIVPFKRISGKTDPYTNHGGYDHIFTIPPQDALFLIAIPRAAKPPV